MIREKDSKLNEALVKNETEANKEFATGCLITAVIILVVWVLILTQVFAVKNLGIVNTLFPIIIVMLAAPFIIVRTRFVSHPALKYFELFSFAFMIALLNIVIPKHAIIAWAAIIVLAAHYYSLKTTLFVYILTVVLMAGATPLCMIFGEWDANLMGVTDTMFSKLAEFYPEHPLPHGGVNPYDIEDRLYYLNHFSYYSGDMDRWLAAFVYYYAARFICITSVFLLSIRLVFRTEKLLVSELEAKEEKSRLSAELNVARDIQLSALPQLFPKDDKIDVYALTHPAKEVGGDFYNVFMWKNKLLFFIADVSGKGVPAALLMMKTNTLLSSMLKNDDNISDALTYTNKELTDHNEKGMFVTSIVGSLDFKTGEVALANAGHNCPLLKQDNKTDYWKLPAGFILGGFPEIKYTSVVKKLHKDDTLFIYTDGVTEAMNEKDELYGEERLLDLFNSLDPNLSSEEICKAINEDVHRFQGEAEQADDITMLCVKYKDKTNRDSFVVPVNKNEVDRIIEFVNNFLEPYDVDMKALSQIDITIDEICSNIFNYAYKDKVGKIGIDISYADDIVTIDFVDEGAPFNPLEKDDPNIDAPIEQRQEGGLGIFIVKQMMDSVSYRYSENKENILTISKKVGK